MACGRAFRFLCCVSESRQVNQRNRKTLQVQNKQAKIKKNNANTLPLCISTKPRQMYITENRPNSKSNIDTKTNEKNNKKMLHVKMTNNVGMQNLSIKTIAITCKVDMEYSLI